MIVKFVSNLRHLLLEPNSYYKYIDFIHIINDNQVKLNEFSSDVFIKHIGLLSAQKLPCKWAFAYTAIDTQKENTTKDEDAQTVMELMEKFKGALTSFDMFLWFIKDSCVCYSDVYAYADTGAASFISSFTSNEICSNSAGDYRDVSFSLSELTECEAIRAKFYSICPLKMEEGIDNLKSFNIDDTMIMKGGGSPEFYNDGNRLERAFKFIYAARASYFLPFKIAMYMPAFECLFSTEAAEVTQKVSERVAFYLYTNNQDRLNAFETMKSAYNVRSRYLHGSLIDKKQKSVVSQTDLSFKIDTIARAVLTKAIMVDSDKFLLKDNEFDMFLKGIIFR